MSTDPRAELEASTAPCPYCGGAREPRLPAKPSRQSDDMEDEYFWDVLPKGMAPRAVEAPSRGL